ncbi:MAG TPA: glycosyltransferase family 39 protein, partial [Polyangiaceae bacterium]|nr:glycosyltransferase family 39 protein [Polyangiaceae bacterium]
MRSVPVILLGAALGIFVMATQASPRVVVPISMFAVLLVTLGVLDFLGSFDDPATVRGHHCRAAELATPLGLAIAGAASQYLLVRASVAGLLPWWGSAMAMPIAFITMVVGGFLVAERLGPWFVDERGEARPLWRRHGFWLVVIMTVVYVPMLGNHGLSDPWETHYGEVAREILARNDWISLWWAQDGWFFSKPVLVFWMQAAAMALTGVRYEPDALMTAVAEGRLPQPEWPLRMTVFLLTVLGVYLLYKGVALVWGRRAALLGALVLITMPQFFFVAHQTMTDMPFTACMAAAVGLLLMALQTDPEERARVWEVRAGSMVVRLSLFHLVMGAVLFVVVPQILYLVSRNVTVADGIHLHGDAFSSGSFANCGLPGNEACKHGLPPLLPSLQPAVQALIWVQML